MRGCTGNTSGRSGPAPCSAADQPGEGRRVVDVARPVQGQHREVVETPELRPQRTTADPGPVDVGEQGVDHHVADAGGSRSGAMPSASRLASASALGVNSKSGQPVGDDPVDLLRHRPVAGPQPRLHVGDRDPQLGRRQRRRPAWSSRHRPPRPRRSAAPSRWSSKRDHDRRGLLRMGAGADVQVHVGTRGCRAPRRRLRHALGRSAGRCGPGWSAARALQGAQDRGHLHEVRAGRGDDGQMDGSRPHGRLR